MYGVDDSIKGTSRSRPDPAYCKHVNEVGCVFTAPLKEGFVRTYVHSSHKIAQEDDTTLEQVEVMMGLFQSILKIDGVIDPVFTDKSYDYYLGKYKKKHCAYSLKESTSKYNMSESAKVTNVDMLLYSDTALVNARDVIVSLHQHRKLYNGMINLTHVDDKLDEKFGVYSERCTYIMPKNDPRDIVKTSKKSNCKCPSLISFISFKAKHILDLMCLYNK